MAKKLHAALKRLYPMNEMCRLIDEHFAGIHGLEQLLLEFHAKVEAVNRSAANGLSLLEGMVPLVQRAPQQQSQQLEQNLALNRKVASAIESVNTCLLQVASQRDERGAQLTSALEQLTNTGGLTSRLVECITALETLHDNGGLAENRNLQELARLREQLAEMTEVLRELDHWHSRQMKQILDYQSLSESRILQEVGRLREQLVELDRRHSSQMQQILERLSTISSTTPHAPSRELRTHAIHGRSES
jgi:hypothetical protein